MPIIDIELVTAHPGENPGLAQALADELGNAFGLDSAKLWVRLRYLPASNYAENGAISPHPAFVTVIASAPPMGGVLEDWLAKIVRIVAERTERPPQLVHVLFEPAARGRIAFGGRLVK